MLPCQHHQMTVYLVAQITIHDREAYARYEAGFGAAFAPHDGRVLSASDAPEVIEGTWSRTRSVIVEFPDREAAMRWYDSPAYQAILPHRLGSSTADIILVDALA